MLTNSELQESMQALDREILAGLDKLKNLRTEVLLLQMAGSWANGDPPTQDSGVPREELQGRASLLSRRAGVFSMHSTSLYRNTEALLASVPGAREIVSEQEFGNFFG